MNNKGFTLIEVITVVAIIALVGLIATPGVLNAINTGKNTSNKILYENIKTASQTMYEEVYYANSIFSIYNNDGITTNNIEIDSNMIETNIQTLVSNGLLVGINNDNTEGENKNTKIILDSNSNDIGECIIKIKKLESGAKIYYQIESSDSNTKEYCPKTEDFKGE